MKNYIYRKRHLSEVPRTVLYLVSKKPLIILDGGR